jgi:XTP/dITP diphosphohydrolase
MTRLLVATTNPHKLREIASLLDNAPVELVGLDALPPFNEPEETGATFEENARLKALYYSRSAEALRHDTGEWGCDLTVAEDSGLVVDALDGEPGVYSARFLRPDATYPERFAEIYRRLDERPDRPRTARFVCAVAVVAAGSVMFETRGTVEGEIASEPRGSAGFGYDPIFHYPAYGRTLAEVDEEEKLRVAHRGQAFRRLAEWFRGRSGERRTENLS